MIIPGHWRIVANLDTSDISVRIFSLSLFRLALDVYHYKIAIL